MKRRAVAVDMGGTNLRFALVSDGGKVLDRFSVPTEAEEGFDSTLSRLLGGIGDMLNTGTRRRAQAVGIGVPSPVDRHSGVVINAPNMPGWLNVPLRTIAEAHFGLPITVENDANCAAVGEHWLGAARGVGTMIQLTLGTGIGGGIIVENRLLLGRDGCAGEVGHTTINVNGPRCACGNRGCLEMYAGVGGILRRFRQRLRAGEPSRLRRRYLDDPTSVTPRDLWLAARSGDRLAASVIEETGSYLGVGIASLVNIFNPERIVLSGGVANAGRMLFDPLRREVRRRVVRAMTRGLTIVRSRLGDNAGLLGAARLALDLLEHGGRNRR